MRLLNKSSLRKITSFAMRLSFMALAVLPSFVHAALFQGTFSGSVRSFYFGGPDIDYAYTQSLIPAGSLVTGSFAYDTDTLSFADSINGVGNFSFPTKQPNQYTVNVNGYTWKAEDSGSGTPLPSMNMNISVYHDWVYAIPKFDDLIIQAYTNVPNSFPLHELFSSLNFISMYTRLTQVSDTPSLLNDANLPQYFNYVRSPDDKVFPVGSISAQTLYADGYASYSIDYWVDQLKIEPVLKVSEPSSIALLMLGLFSLFYPVKTCEKSSRR